MEARILGFLFMKTFYQRDENFAHYIKGL